MDHHTDHFGQEIETPAPISTKKSLKKLLIGFTSLILVIGSLVVLNMPNTQTQGVGSYRNWSADAIIQGGAITEKELIDKYNADASGVQGIFKHYGIGLGDLNGKTSKIVHGRVNRDGTVVDDKGKVVATGAYSVSRKPFVDSRDNAPKKVTTASGVTLYDGPNMSIFVRDVDAYILMRDGVFYRAIISSCANPVIATPTEKKKPEPIYTCNSLTSSRIERDRFRFTTSAVAANGADIVEYTFDFGDGNKETTRNNSYIHKYDKPGNYTVTVTVNFKVNGKTELATDAKCATKVTVEEEPKVAVYKCETLTKRAIIEEANTYVFNLSYTADNATLNKVVYDFGDNIKETYSADEAIEVKHQYGLPGDYDISTTLHFSVNEGGKTVEKTASCTEKVTVPQPDKCPIPGKEHLPKNSPDCTEPIEMPEELPQTGLGEWLAGGVGLAALAAAVYYWKASERNLRNKLLKEE